MNDGLMMNVLAQIMLPQNASNLGEDIDFAWHVILAVTTFFFFVVVGAMTFFVIKYRRKTPNDVTSPITHNTPIEIVWTVVPLIIVLVFFFVGFFGFLNYDNPPSNAQVINAVASQWQFSFKYPNGGEDRNLYLQKDKAVRIDMTSVDVLHAFYVPEFRTQRNFVPGRVTNVWFIPTAFSPPAKGDDPGGWPIYCTQYCGDGHSRMVSRVHVLDEAAYIEKMKEVADPFKKKDKEGKSHFVPFVTLGETMYKQMGCMSCHSITGTAGTGPTWKDLYGRDHEFSFTDATSVVRDGLKGADPESKWDDYLRESMLKPDAALVVFEGKAYHGMPSYVSSLGGSVPNIEKQRAITAYIKSLGTKGWKPEITPETEPRLFDADNTTLIDPDTKLPLHPESLAGIKARQGGGTQPAPAP